MIFFLVAILTAACSCQKDPAGSHPPLASLICLSGTETGITFSNTVTETNWLNILTYFYFYNGGGVAVGDINDDGLPDLYFTANMGSNRLYLNKGNLKFEDITEKSGTGTQNEWSTGATMVDINADGKLDIYVCQVDGIAGLHGQHKLFINHGDLTFSEEAAKFHLDFRGHGTQAAFFDYDRDGDLDCYLLNHSLKNPHQYVPAQTARQQFDPASGDALYKNTGTVFTDVTDLAHIYHSSIGFGLGIAIEDLNGDHWPDIYVGNDFYENDYLYLNQHDGTFKEVINEAVGHTSNFTMGVAIADINGDNLPDILSLDMKPEDEFTYKSSGGWESLNLYRFKRTFGYAPQLPKNALQINQGAQGSMSRFSEEASRLGIESTDWSWSPLIADFTMDGKPDVFITNGIPHRPNNLDFINYYSNEHQQPGSPLALIQSIPTGENRNYFYVQDPKNFSFEQEEIPDMPSGYVNGATYADLDRDGDLDIICNALNHEAFIIKNNTANPDFLNIRLRSPGGNPDGIGARVCISDEDGRKCQSIFLNSGFESSKEARAYFALQNDKIDHVEITWPDGQEQIVHHPGTGFIEIQKDSTFPGSSPIQELVMPSKDMGLVHVDTDEGNEQNDEKWMPYLLSTFGPRVTARDGWLYETQNRDEKGNRLILHGGPDRTLALPNVKRPKGVDENDAALVDLNGDHLVDLYIATGGNALPRWDTGYADELLIQTADGQFIEQHDLPPLYLNNSVVKPCDFDLDGDEDLFIGVLSRPGHFGISDSSYLLINIGTAHFTVERLPVRNMVFDATWTDLDQDGRPDLCLAGHWMPITYLLNTQHGWVKQEIKGTEGLWFSILASDINHDAKPDLIAGNYGTNHHLHATEDDPFLLYINDFDGNGRGEPLFTYVHEGIRYPFPNLETFLAQVPSYKKDYQYNKSYAGSTVQQIIASNLLSSAITQHCNTLESAIFINENAREGYFIRQALPVDLQLAPIWVMLETRPNEFAFGGNFFDVDPNWGRQDALMPAIWSVSSTSPILFKKIKTLPVPFKEIRDMAVVHDSLIVAARNDALIQLPIH